MFEREAPFRSPEDFTLKLKANGVDVTSTVYRGGEIDYYVGEKKIAGFSFVNDRLVSLTFEEADKSTAETEEAWGSTFGEVSFSLNGERSFLKV